MGVTVEKHKNFVGGEWVEAAAGETMPVLNPATGETIAEVPAATAEDVDRAVQAAKRALPEWLETTPGERGRELPHRHHQRVVPRGDAADDADRLATEP